MKLVVRFLCVTALLAVTAGVASAHHNTTPRVDRRQARQEARIDQGVQSDELTAAETRRLRAGQRRIQRMEEAAKADGHVSPAERRLLNHALKHESRAISRLKHNDRTR